MSAFLAAVDQPALPGSGDASALALAHGALRELELDRRVRRT